MTKNYAHRGFSSKYPENTMLAFEKAIEVGAHGIEFDVQVTKDGKLVIIHDETIDRTSNGKGKVKDFTYEELLKFDFSVNYNEQEEPQRIPLLSEYFELVKDIDIISNIELKNSVYEYEGIEEKVYDLVGQYKLKNKVIISSFNHESIMRMKAIDESIECGFLIDSWMLNPGKYTKYNGIECFHPSAYSLTKEKVQEIQSHGVKVNVWLGKEPFDYRKLVHMGVDGLISNDPDIVKDLLEK